MKQGHLWQSWIKLLINVDMPLNKSLLQIVPKMYLILPQEEEQYGIWSQILLEQKILPNLNEIQNIETIDLINRLYSYILPLVWVCTKKIQTNDKMIIGLNGMQGCGKSTLGGILQWVFAFLDIQFDTVSLDDFYLTYQERQQLDPAIFKYRGPPGTHSIELIRDFIKRFKETKKDEKLLIPVFNKSLFQGQGDRESFREIHPKTQIVLFEGWMQGFRSIQSNQLQEKFPGLLKPDQVNYFTESDLPIAQHFNQELIRYNQIWDQIDYFVILQAQQYKYSIRWRLEAEQKMRETIGGGMADNQILDFITFYWNALHPEIYCQTLKYDVKFEVDEQRNIINCDQII